MLKNKNQAFLNFLYQEMLRVSQRERYVLTNVINELKKINFVEIKLSKEYKDRYFNSANKITLSDGIVSIDETKIELDNLKTNQIYVILENIQQTK